MFAQPEAVSGSLKWNCWGGGYKFGLNLEMRLLCPLGSKQWGHLVGSWPLQPILGPAWRRVTGLGFGVWIVKPQSGVSGLRQAGSTAVGLGLAETYFCPSDIVFLVWPSPPGLNSVSDSGWVFTHHPRCQQRLPPAAACLIL